MNSGKGDLDLDGPAGMGSFVARFRDLGMRETRSIFLIKETEGAPAGEYGFLEFYCEDRKCDCRRVLFEVRPASEPDRVLAVINFGWESEEFYTKWMHGNREGAREVRGATLDPLHRQSQYAPLFLRLFREVLLSDRAYVERLAAHYRLHKISVRKGKRR